MLDYFRYVGPWYLLTVLLESPFVIVGIKNHTVKTRVIWAFLLTAATYPFVTLVFPRLMPDYGSYVITSEVFAATAEPLLFWICMDRKTERRDAIRNAVLIFAANVFSFLCGEFLKYRLL